MPDHRQQLVARFPTLDEVDDADLPRLLAWNRFLPAPRVLAEVEAVRRIVEALAIAREHEPARYVRDSKALGW